jgi:hypothetical protein
MSEDKKKNLLEMLKISAPILGFLIAGILGCNDEGKVPSTAPIVIAKSLTVGLDTVYTFPQDTVILTIHGGLPPYSITPPPTSAAQCSITDSTLTITGISNGLNVAKITDASSPVHSVGLPIVVGTAISFNNNIQPIFVSRYGCSGTVGGCHGGTMGLFLDNATVSYQNLVNVPAQSSAFIGYKRVAPRNLANSLLYIRLSSNDPAISMPQGRTAPFDSTYLNDVRTWIRQGARFN